jgi:hypothetical protein
MSRRCVMCALVVAAIFVTPVLRFIASPHAATLNLALQPQGGAISVSVQPAAAIEIVLVSASPTGKVLTKTDQNGKSSFDSSGLAGLGNLTINEETCAKGRRVLLVASGGKAPQNPDCKTTQIGTFVVGKDVVLNARLSGSFTPAIGAVAIPEPATRPPSQAAAPPQPTGTKPPASSTGVVFRDDFTKPTPDTAWQIDLEDRGRWAIGDGELVIVTQPRVAVTAPRGEPAVRNRFVLDRELPGNYTINARLSVAVVRAGTTVALRVRTPDGDYVAVGYDGFLDPGQNPHRRAFLGKMQGGVYAAIPSSGDWDRGKPTQVDMDAFVKNPELVWLRLEKKGFSFIGSFSLDGNRFETLGEQALLRTEGSRLDLVGYDVTKGVESGVRFDYIEVIR